MRLVGLLLVALLTVLVFACVAHASPEDVLEKLEALERRVEALEKLLRPNVPGRVVLEKAEFTGKGILQTEPFKVLGPWVLEWFSSDERFTLMVLSIDDSSPPATVGGASSGRSFFPRPGVYYLSVIASGEWKVTVSEYTESVAHEGGS